MEDERDRLARERLTALDVDGPVLDLGCGRGDIPGRLGISAVGVDVALDRLREAPFPVVQADARRLPVATGSVGLVLVFNVLSSVPDARDRTTVVAEIRRVLRPAGAVLWYDQRWPNPGNAATRAVPRIELRALFPRAAIDVVPVTLAAPLARRFTGAYDRLASVRVLRTHLLGVVRPAVDQ